VPIVLLVPALLYALAFLFMPFSVIGVKGRLDVIEARLDEIQGEIRHLALRLPETVRATDYGEIYAPEPTERRAASPVITRPPIPPATHELEDEQPDVSPRSSRRNPDRDASRDRPQGGRSEPRLDWPR
jgi:hypothetical protein